MNTDLIQVLMERLNLSQRQAEGAIEIITSYMQSHVPPQNRDQAGGLLSSLLGGGALAGLIGNAGNLFGDNSSRGVGRADDGQFGVDDVVRGLSGLMGGSDETARDPNVRSGAGSTRTNTTAQDDDGFGLDDVVRGLGGLLDDNNRR